MVNQGTLNQNAKARRSSTSRGKARRAYRPHRTIPPHHRPAQTPRRKVRELFFVLWKIMREMLALQIILKIRKLLKSWGLQKGMFVRELPEEKC